MKIKRIDSLNDERFKKCVLNQHGAFLIDDKFVCEFEIINTEEAIVSYNEPFDIIEVIEEFRFYSKHIIRFYNDKKELIIEYSSNQVFWLNVAKIQPSQIYISEDKMKAISTFINDETDIIIPVAVINKNYVSLDGHTRLYYAYQKGFKKVRVLLSDFDPTITKFVEESTNRGVYNVSDMILLSHNEYLKKWYSLCDLINREKNRKLVILLDMFGCPNRCKHCFVGHSPNLKIDDDSDIKVVNYFKPFFDEIKFYSWTREPDYTEDFESRWIKDCDISINSKPQRFELASFYKIVREPEYVKFLKKVGTKKVQISFFGLEENTDYFIGRKGAFKELLKATEILIDNEIAPRYQVFINKKNKNEIIKLIHLTEELGLKERCQKFGQEFKLFINEGSPDGENRKLMDLRIDFEDIDKELISYYFDYENLKTESDFVEALKHDDTYLKYEYKDEMVLYISNTFDVYYNFTEMSPKWKIGNLINENKDELMRKILNLDVEAINIAKKTPISYLINEYGDSNSKKVFSRNDYLHYLLLLHLDKGGEM